MSDVNSTLQYLKRPGSFAQELLDTQLAQRPGVKKVTPEASEVTTAVSRTDGWDPHPKAAFRRVLGESTHDWMRCVAARPNAWQHALLGQGKAPGIAGTLICIGADSMLEVTCVAAGAVGALYGLGRASWHNRAVESIEMARKDAYEWMHHATPLFDGIAYVMLEAARLVGVCCVGLLAAVGACVGAAVGTIKGAWAAYAWREHPADVAQRAAQKYAEVEKNYQALQSARRRITDQLESLSRQLAQANELAQRSGRVVAPLIEQSRAEEHAYEISLQQIDALTLVVKAHEEAIADDSQASSLADRETQRRFLQESEIMAEALQQRLENTKSLLQNKQMQYREYYERVKALRDEIAKLHGETAGIDRTIVSTATILQHAEAAKERAEAEQAHFTTRRAAQDEPAVSQDEPGSASAVDVPSESADSRVQQELASGQVLPAETPSPRAGRSQSPVLGDFPLGNPNVVTV